MQCSALRSNESILSHNFPRAHPDKATASQ